MGNPYLVEWPVPWVWDSLGDCAIMLGRHHPMEIEELGQMLLRQARSKHGMEFNFPEEAPTYLVTWKCLILKVSSEQCSMNMLVRANMLHFLDFYLSGVRQPWS